MKSRWIRFTRRHPPKNRKVLVTNNLAARDSYGDMSHLWIATPFRSVSEHWYTFDNCDQQIYNLTHWMPLPKECRQMRRQAK